MTCPWWKEAYKSGAARIFDMPVAKGRFHHLMFRKCSIQSNTVKSFNRVLRASKSDDYVEEGEPVRKPLGKGKSRWDSSGEGGKPRRRYTEVERLISRTQETFERESCLFLNFWSEAEKHSSRSNLFEFLRELWILNLFLTVLKSIFFAIMRRPLVEGVKIHKHPLRTVPSSHNDETGEMSTS